MEAPTINEPITPSEIALAAVEYGTINALDAYVRLKRIEKQQADDMAQAMARVKDAAIAEAAKYGKGEHDAFGARVTNKAGAGRWDFSSLDWYLGLEAKRKAKEEQAKAAFKAGERGQTIVDDETGEVVQPANYTPGADTISIKLIA